MTRKAQLSFYIILGILLIIITGFLVSSISSKGETNIELEQGKAFFDIYVKADIEKIIFSCIKYSVEESLSETGIREENLNQFNEFVKLNLIECSYPILNQLEEKGYEIEKEVKYVASKIYPETISLEISFPIRIEKDNKKIELDLFDFSFDRSSRINIPGGITKNEIRLISENGKAELIIPKDVIITDKNNNPVENIGIKVLDLYFDDLENRVIIGNLVYETFPENTFFSEPIRLSIEFREDDLPEDYGLENIRIAYWSEEDGIWYAPPTEIKDNLAIANITHFSKWANSVGKPALIQTIVFEKRFEPILGSPEGERSGVWLISGEEGSREGTATLQRDFYKIGYQDWTISYISSILGIAEGIDAVRMNYENEFRDYKEERENMKNKFISFNKLQYGYYLNPENPKDDEFIDCEEYNPNNIGNIDYFLKQGYPWIRRKYNDIPDYVLNHIFPEKSEVAEELISKGILVEYEEGKYTYEEFGWHNLQCPGGIVRPGENEEAAEFIVFQPNGNSVIAILGMEIYSQDKPLIYPYAYPMENTVSVDYPSDYYTENSDYTYPFYCDFISFSNGEEFKKINLSQEAIENLGSKGIDINKKIFAYGIQGINVIKKTDHPLSRYEMNAMCEVFWIYWGDGFITTNTPEGEIFQDLNLNPKQGLIAEILGTALLKDTIIGKSLVYLNIITNIFN